MQCHITPMEVRIIHLISEGLTNKEIAAQMNRSFRTIEKYREKILDKTNSRNTANLIYQAIKMSIIKID